MTILIKIWCKYMAIENLKKHTVSALLIFIIGFLLFIASQKKR
jgi:hypothetical protein